MLRSPPAATVNCPFKSPPHQLSTALLATVSGALMVPPPRFIVPCKVLVPVHWAITHDPLTVCTVPVVLNCQSTVAKPAPPVFCIVPVLMQVLVPRSEE